MNPLNPSSALAAKRCPLLAAVLVAALVAAGCSETPVAGTGCDSAVDCEAGTICRERLCVRLCYSGADCARGEACTSAGVCELLSTGPLPVIDGISGNDAADLGKIRDGLVVFGSALASATFELRVGNDVAPLTIRRQSENEAELILPADVRSGVYGLAAVNASGSDQQEITLTLPELTGDVLLSRLNTATGTVGIARLPVGETGDSVARGDHVHDDRYYGRAEADALFAQRSQLAGGGNLIANAYFLEGAGGLAGWTAAAGSVVAADPDAPFGTLAFANTVLGATAILRSAPFALAPGKGYRFEAWVKRVDGEFGLITLAAEIYDGAGELLMAFNHTDQVTDDLWHPLVVGVGPGAVNPMPPGAAYGRLALAPNGSSTNAGNPDAIVQVLAPAVYLESGLQLSDDALQVAAARLDIGTPAVTTGKLNVGGVITATGLDVGGSITADGLSVASSLVAGGLTVGTAGASIDGDIDVSAGMSVGGTLGVTGATNLDGDLDVGGVIRGDVEGTIGGAGLFLKLGNIGDHSCAHHCGNYPTNWGRAGLCVAAVGNGNSNYGYPHTCADVNNASGDYAIACLCIDP